jgi:glyceraldehyde-3-phosphate dehydrogenase/erythrose-4-phosphate dehydrogenase
MKNIVHIVGTGTIGEPLIGLFTDFKQHLGIDEVTFHKRTPMKTERAKVNHLMTRGAHLAAEDDKVADFEALGHKVSYTAQEAMERATVVLDCTPAGNDNKEQIYNNLKGPVGFLAQGSEFGFGKMYARGINDSTLIPGEDKFLQIVSCNTHNLAILIKTLGMDDAGKLTMERAQFVCMRRSNDISQTKDYSPAPTVGKHDDDEFGTHHAHDVYHLYETLHLKPKVFSSAIKLNTQYMHSVWFNFELKEKTDKKKVLDRRADGAQGRERSLLVRPRPRLLRPHPLPDGHLDADARRRGRGARDRGLLLHAAGRQLAALVHRGRDLAHGPRAREPAHPGPEALRLHGDLGEERKRPKRRLS